MSGKVGHFELPADDTKRAKKFYAATFGWKYSEVPGMEYTMVRTGTVDDQGMPNEPGVIGGAIAKREGNLMHPVITIMVDEISAVEKVIEKNGGKIILRKQAIGDGSMGHMGYFKDSEGNIVGLYQMPTP
jgi:uncharacterized protein